MLVRALALVLTILCGAGAAQAASTFSGFPPATQPLGSIPDRVPLDQGAGCPANTAPCTTSNSPHHEALTRDQIIARLLAAEAARAASERAVNGKQ